VTILYKNSKQVKKYIYCQSDCFHELNINTEVLSKQDRIQERKI